MVRLQNPYKKSGSSAHIGSLCKWLLLPVLLVIFVTIYLRQTKEASNGLNPNTTTNKGGWVRGSETPSPTPAPTPRPIEVKSHEEVQEHINNGGGNINGDEDDTTNTTGGTNHPPAHFYTEDTAEIMFQDFTYRFPSQHFHNFSQYDGNVVVGVLSAPQQVSRRETIRKTWAYQRSNVFFLISGDWDSIVEEIRHNRDIFWVNAPENINTLVIKTQAFVGAATKHLTFRYILKADDDSYIRLANIEKEASQPKTSNDGFGNGLGSASYTNLDSDDSDTKSGDSDEVQSGSDDNSNEQSLDGVPASGTEHTDVNWSDFDYIGSCVMNRPIKYDDNPHGLPGVVVPSVTQEFPTYASGAGYLISHSFATCFAQVSQKAPMLSNVEDANTGLFAQACRVPCQHSDRFLNFPDASILLPGSQSDYVVAHYLGQYQYNSVEDTMVALHTYSCRKSDADLVSCGEGSLHTLPDSPAGGANVNGTSQSDDIPDGDDSVGDDNAGNDDNVGDDGSVSDDAYGGGRQRWL